MTVKQTILNPEQQQAEQARQAASEKEFASRLVNSMDLPSTLTQGIDEHAKEPVEVEEPEQETEVEAEEEVVEETEEEAAEQTEPESEESEEEDLIPKSKVQKRFDEQTAQIKKLERELQKEKEAREAAQPKSDPQQEALEKMSADELKTLKRQIRVEQIRAGSDEAKLNPLLDLEEKIDRTIQTAPQRFQQNQISRFNQAVQQTAESLENFESVKQTIFQHAKAIYDSSPELQGSVAGQERAWKFAVDHFTAIQKASEGKSDTNELKRQVNTLKKKISIDTTSKKGVQVPDSDAKLKRKAINGNESDKVAFLKTRINTKALVSDDELQSLERTRR